MGEAADWAEPNNDQPNATDLRDLFKPGEEVVAYRDLRELRKQLDFYLARPDEARAIGENARRRALAEHTLRHRVEEMVATPATTLLFGAIMGFLWMGVGPLVAGAVAEMFGLKWQAMIQGLAFMSHQIGSFLGAYGGGLIYDSLGSYTMAWRIGVALGLAGGIIQVAFALIRPSGPPQMQTA